MHTHSQRHTVVQAQHTGVPESQLPLGGQGGWRVGVRMGEGPLIFMTKHMGVPVYMPDTPERTKRKSV